MPSTTIKIDKKVKDILSRYKEEFGSKTFSDTISILALKFERLKLITKQNS